MSLRIPSAMSHWMDVDLTAPGRWYVILSPPGLPINRVTFERNRVYACFAFKDIFECSKRRVPQFSFILHTFTKVSDVFFIFTRTTYGSAGEVSSSDRSVGQRSKGLNYEWVDPSVLNIPTGFRDSNSLDKFLSKVAFIKLDCSSDALMTDIYGYTDRVCHGRENAPHDFFFVYNTFFAYLHITLPFDDFTMGVLRILNMAPTQLHPNSWAAFQAFRVLCDIF